VAFDPLDGSANMETNGTAGAIFSILPALATPAESFAQPGTAVIAAGFAVFGPAVTLVITLGEGTHIFALDRAIDGFLLVERNVRIPNYRFEYVIN
jgi:fructose-1,6-bisphosphatase I